ncbi:hypothetical protein [Streptomyces sp. NBC_00286]|uniref:hypothetical protein n=1 Tax=Streptomyces sp. NBC_00286 TaxID=2975701 RepID=UPI002E299DF3|nr:hypothetical protein [Streptomyces sp. NBC_00286]
MKDAEILAQFDGRGRAEFLLGGFEAMSSDKITAFAFEFGYDLYATETPSKSTMRLIYERNDSPTARRRAQQTVDRLRAGGPLLAPWAAPGPQPGTTSLKSAIEIAAVRRRLAAYEASGAKGLVVLTALLSLGFLALAWVARGSLGGVIILSMVAVCLAVVAVLIPRWLTRWYEKNRQLIRLYDQQRHGHVGPPPPPPPHPNGPADRQPGQEGGP